MTPSATGLGLYVHLPFCPSRCPYCDFYAEKYRPGQARELIAGLALHLERIAPRAGGRPLATLYIGGGTPSMWPASALSDLLQAAHQHLGLEPEAEVSLEANPATLSQAKLRALRKAGFNRLSLGAQSFDPGLLEVLGRRHGPGDIRRTVEQARVAGFDNLNLDLIYGLPGQTLAMATGDLEQALDLSTDHLSLYELTLGPDTPFGRRYTLGQSPLPNDAAMYVMEDAALSLLPACGLARYEVSNFARPGYECRHNQATWRGGDYLALGPGAHGHLAGRRWAYVADVAAYLTSLAQEREPYQFIEDLTPSQRALELIMLGLRTLEGVSLAALKNVLDADPAKVYKRAIDQACARGWAVLTPTHLRPTPLGLRMADGAAGLFID